MTIFKAANHLLEPSTSQKCRALGLADGEPCQSEIASADGAFCRFHARQCYGLYIGYKRRNSQLDELVGNPPPYLASTRTSIANADFTDITDIQVLEDIHSHLFRRHALLDRVIKARRLHHVHFYAQDMDYGHERYLNMLISQKFNVLKALERVVQRLTELLYQEHTWFKWAKERQDERDKQREQEKQKVKKEAILFRSQTKDLEKRLRAFRLKEDARKQEAFLEQAYQGSRTDMDGDEWDPIEDVLESERTTYIDIIKHFLWSDDQLVDDVQTPPLLQDHSSAESTTSAADTDQNSIESPANTILPQPTKKAKKKRKKSSKLTEVVSAIPGPTSSQASTSLSTSLKGVALKPIGSQSQAQSLSVEVQPDKSLIEGRTDMQNRLLAGTSPKPTRSCVFGDSKKFPVWDCVAGIPAPEVTRLLEEIAEIKNFLFCRLILGHATLFPFAAKAQNLEEFYKNPEVKTADLRDLCLKLSQPQLQDIRDACGDFFRSVAIVDSENGTSPDLTIDGDDLRSQSEIHIAPEVTTENNPPSPRHSADEESDEYVRRRNSGGISATSEMTPPEPSNLVTQTDSDMMDDESRCKKRTLRVRICGRFIYHYPVQGPLNRGGWLHFSIIAKSCSFSKAIELCKSWDEFHELNVLTLHGYFPIPAWLMPACSSTEDLCIHLGFIPYYAYRGNTNSLGPSDDHSINSRYQSLFEARNLICGQMKRNDRISRRFIQRVSMQTSGLLMAVRDGKTGGFIVVPPPKESWLTRRRKGTGRARKVQWETLSCIGPELFEHTDRSRFYHSGVTDYYDVYIWSSQADVHWSILEYSLLESLCKAHRVTQPLDLYRPSASCLKTLTYHPTSQPVRARDIQSGEIVKSVYDELEHRSDEPCAAQNFEVAEGELTKWCFKYSERDKLEDEILFPQEESLANYELELGFFTDALSLFPRLDVCWAGIGAQGLDPDDEYPTQTDDDPPNDLQGQGSGKDPVSTSPHSSRPDSVTKLNSTLNDRQVIHDQDVALDDSSRTTIGSVTTDIDLKDWKDFEPDGQAEIDVERLYKLDLSTPLKNKPVLSYFGPAPITDTDMMALWSMYMTYHHLKVLKPAWHQCDFEPGAQGRWKQCLSIQTAAVAHFATTGNLFPACAGILEFLNFSPKAHQRVAKDIKQAYCSVVLYASQRSSFFDRETGAGYKYRDSMLFRQKERSQQLPDRRSSASADLEGWCPGIDFINSPDTFLAQAEGWDVTIRPQLARLYKAGLIKLSYPRSKKVIGQAFVGTEAARPHSPDLFFAFASNTKANLPISTTGLDKITISSLLSDCEIFHTQSPGAAYSLLRIWSAPHFYPQGLPEQHQHLTAFSDAIGRVWKWDCVPKDFPHSGDLCHDDVQSSFKDYMHKFQPAQALRAGTSKKRNVKASKVTPSTCQIRIRKDVVLIWGKDEEELLRFTAAAVFLIQTKPWNLEVDFWKSFINVDLEFLKGLQEEWWL